jgi:hypothetical protein
MIESDADRADRREDRRDDRFEARTDDKFTKMILGIVAVLIGAGVIALWQMTANVARLEERVGLWTRVFETRFEDTSKNVHELDRRVDRLELRGGVRPEER